MLGGREYADGGVEVSGAGVESASASGPNMFHRESCFQLIGQDGVAAGFAQTDVLPASDGHS